MKEITFKRKDEILEMLRCQGMYDAYQKLTERGKKSLIEFCTGESLKALTYDSIFKMIFNPEYHRERLEHFLSAILGFEVQVLEVLPVESTKMLETGSIMIMDILVKTRDGCIVNVEMQRCPYKFTGKRDSCYLADMIMRQYNGLKARIREEEGEYFSYEDMKPVYSLIFLEKSYGDMLNYPDLWEHSGNMEFNTGLKMDFLGNIRYIQLDNFRKIVDNNITTEKEMWVALLSANTPEKVTKVAGMSEEMFEIVSDVAEFVTDVGKVMNMFSEALRMLDRNTEKLMMDEAMEEIKNAKKQVEDLNKEAEKAREEVKKANEHMEEAKQRAEEEKQRAEEEKQRAEEEKQRAEEAKQRAEEANEKVKQAQLQVEIVRRAYIVKQPPEEIAKELGVQIDYINGIL